MPNNDIKSLLDSIIDNTNKSYPAKNEIIDKSITAGNLHPTTFDSGDFREKLSLYVLKDLVCAMMHDETKDLNEMIDQSIIDHIKANYNGSCYGYLCNARDRLKTPSGLSSPLMSSIIQEIDNKTDEVGKELAATKDSDLINGKIDTKELLKNVNDYDEFRQKLTDNVTKRVINDVAKVVGERNDAATFDGLDDALKVENEKNKTTAESVILNICSGIVTEAAIAKKPISTEEGLNKAIVEYCIAEMDFLLKANPKVSIYSKYKI